MALADDVNSLKDTVQSLQAVFASLVNLQHSLSACQIAAEANLKAIEHIFPGGTAHQILLVLNLFCNWKIFWKVTRNLPSLKPLKNGI